MASSVLDENDGSHTEQPSKQSSWRRYLWDYWDKSPEEQKLLLKMDLTLMTFGCLSTFIKYLDKSNLQNAFVSGMKEDMDLFGNEMNYANTAYSIGNIIAIWPCNLLLTRTNPRYFIPLLEIGWTITTFCQSVMTKPIHMYVLRVILAIFETGHFSAVVYLCGAWYKKEELSRRVAIINMTTAIGPMFSSYLQAAAYNGLDGVSGRSGWRWLFIIDGCISLGIILPQPFFYPDVPARQKPDRLFTEREIELARDRNPREGRVKQGSFTLKQVKRWVFTPDIWLLWLISLCNDVCQQPALSITYWFKAWNTIKPGSYTVAQINNYATPIQAVIVVFNLSFAWASDTVFRGRRWPLLVIGSSLSAVIFFTLASTPVFPENRAGRWTLYYLTGLTQATSTMFWSWTQDTLSGDPATRAFASAGLNVWAYVGSATIPLGLFKTVDQPGVVAGNYGAGAFAILHSLTALTLAFIQHRRRAKGKELFLVEDDVNNTRAEDDYSTNHDISKVAHVVDEVSV